MKKTIKAAFFFFTLMCFFGNAVTMFGEDSEQNLFDRYTHFLFYGDSNLNFGSKISLPFGSFLLAENLNEMNFGCEFNTFKIEKTFPITMKCGNLSSGGIISKMKNPLPSSSVSPFSSGISEPCCATSSLPSFTNFSNPVSSFFQLGFENKNLFVKSARVNCFYSPDKEVIVFSSLIKTDFLNDLLKLSASTACGISSYNENNDSSWFSDEKRYHSGKHASSMLQLSAQIPNLLFGFQLSVFENQFGVLDIAYRADVKTNIKKLNLFATAFYNPNQKLLTLSDKKIDKCFILKNGIQYKFMLKNKIPLFVKTGLSSHLDLKLLKEEHQLKIGAGVQITSFLFSAGLNILCDTTLNTKNSSSPSMNLKSTSVSTQASFYINDAITGLSFSIDFNPSKNFDSLTIKYKALIKASYSKFSKTYGNASYSWQTKDGTFISKKLSLSLNTKHSYKKSELQLKLSADFEL